MLCSEPLLFRPWEIGRLTPFQVRRVLLVERDKKGVPVLDPPADDGPAEISMEQEWRRHWIMAGVSDPDAIRQLVKRGLTDDDRQFAAEPAGGVDGLDE